MLLYFQNLAYDPDLRNLTLGPPKLQTIPPKAWPYWVFKNGEPIK